MRQSRQIRVVLDIEPDGEPIRGSLSAVDHDSRPFFGWLELVGAVEAARRPAAGDGAKRQSRTVETILFRKH
jgi:hypothetical protein